MVAIGPRVGSTLFTRRTVMRPLVLADFEQWREVRRANVEWLTKWEPQRVPGGPDTVEHSDAFSVRCAARQREWHLGVGFGFGIFVNSQFAGEVNINSVQRGPFQNAYIGYWIDQRLAGHSYVPEAVVSVFRFAFEELNLHRLQISIIPRNRASLRVVEKLGLRCEGLAERYLEINGNWEDHFRFALTSEEWLERQVALSARWLAD